MNSVEFINQYRNLADLIESNLTKYAESPAFSCLGHTVTYREVDNASRAFACYLQHKLKLNAGDRIAIQLPNLIQYPIAMYGALRAGLVIVNTNPLYTSREMLHQFNDSGAKAIVILDDLLDKYSDIQGELAINHVIVTGISDLLTDERPGYQCDSFVSFNQALSEGASFELSPSKASLEDVCVLQYTGGTTGVSKGAALTHYSIGCNLYQTLQPLAPLFREQREILACPLPLYHIYAFSLAMLMQPSKGNLVVLIPNARDLQAVISQLSAFRITVFAGLNTLFVGLGRHPDFRRLDFSQMMYSLSAGTALTEAANSLWREVTGSIICEGYGLSETSPVLTVNDPSGAEFGTVGRPVQDTEIQFWDSNDQPVAEGERGQIVARGPQNMHGYWNMPEETAKVMKNGFFKTGDIGVCLPDGRIKIVDRLKDMIIVSGFNVFPNEIESVLTQHPVILEAAVIGEPDSKTGERVSAYITVSDFVDPLDVTEFCRKYLTAYKVPKQVSIVESLPKSSVGKILRRELRAT